VRAITDQYDACTLECDGMTNVEHYYLALAGIVHTVYEGYVLDDSGEDPEADGITWHRWIQFQAQEGPAVIDYRARMWLGQRESVPHGVFREASFPHIHYRGDPIEPPCLPPSVIQFLVERPDIQAERTQEGTSEPAGGHHDL